jgi:hypothetical protein
VNAALAEAAAHQEAKCVSALASTDPWIARAKAARSDNGSAAGASTPSAVQSESLPTVGRDAWIANVTSQPPPEPAAAASPGRQLLSEAARQLAALRGGGAAAAAADPVVAAVSRSASSTGSFEAAALQTSAMFMVPLEYLIFNNRPRRVLVCGWGERSFMHTLLHELDAGGVR